MYKRFVIAAAVAAAALTARCSTIENCSASPSCCSITPPNVSITGEKTVIERQIIGDYMEIEKDAWAISSVRTTVGQKNISGKMAGDPELFKYTKIREFHNEKIKEYKNEGAIGESNNGFIQYMETKKYEVSPAEKKILLTVIEEENLSRREIFTRLMYLSKERAPEKSEVDAFGRLFAEEQRGLALKGEWIQQSSGKWERKK
ncbi:MAG: YdbL family protein [Leptospirales bacterium]|nr:YdbL family protein [Leptospirales bacterium]